MILNKNKERAFALSLRKDDEDMATDNAVAITPKEFQQLSGYIKANYGIFLKEEKKSILTGRLQRVLSEQGFDNFTDYYNHIIADKTGKAIVTLVDQVTTNHTFFMREAEHFYYFKETVLPFWVENAEQKDLRIWCAACSTGEEAYTLAMLIDEFLGKEKPLWDSKILATDISSRVLDIAQNGIYEKDRIAPLPSIWKMNYFRKADANNYAVIDRIKKEVIYRKFNLMDTVFPFKRKFHVIFCRNVMIYFDRETRNDLIKKMLNSLEYGGYLFIGHSESVSKDIPDCKYIRPAVYRKE